MAQPNPFSRAAGPPGPPPPVAAGPPPSGPPGPGAPYGAPPSAMGPPPTGPPPMAGGYAGMPPGPPPGPPPVGMGPPPTGPPPPPGPGAPYGGPPPPPGAGGMPPGPPQYGAPPPMPGYAPPPATAPPGQQLPQQPPQAPQSAAPPTFPARPPPTAQPRRPLYPEDAATAAYQPPPTTGPPAVQPVPMYQPPPSQAQPRRSSGGESGLAAGPSGYAPPQGFASPQGAYGPPQPGQDAYGGYGAPPPTAGQPVQQMVSDFGALSMGPSYGGAPPPPAAGEQYGAAPAAGLDPLQLPRPAGLTVGPAATAADRAREEGDLLLCSQRFVRMTVNAIPNSASLRAKWALPLGAIVHPLAEPPPGEEPVPVVNFGPAGVIRCRRCRTYVNPFVQFVEGGRRWRCNLCGLVNDVPVEYFCATDQAGVRRDARERPELTRASVEFVAPAEYMVRPPQPPVYFFVLDVSYSAVASGLLRAACEAVKRALPHLPGAERTQVGLITYDAAVHYYAIRPGAAQPQMLVLGVQDLEDVFLPVPDDLLCNASECRGAIEGLLDRLPAMFGQTRAIDAALAAAVQAAFLVCQHVGGKVCCFVGTLPGAGPARLKNREAAVPASSTSPGERERQLLQPDPDAAFYKKAAVDCSRQQICVDLFVAAGGYADLATLSALPQFTGGDLYHYPAFSASRAGDVEKLTREVERCLTRATGFEAVMRIRCSRGLRISSFHGHFFIRSTDLLALPNVDADKAFAVQIAHEESVIPSSHAFLQCALLYTTSTGERRIRVHTACVPVAPSLADLYKYADVEAVANLMARLAAEQAFGTRVEDARRTLQERAVEALAAYRTLCTSASRAANQLIFPEALKLLPLYVLALLKAPAFRNPGDPPAVRADERAAALRALASLPPSDAARYVYPRLVALHRLPQAAGLEASAPGEVNVPGCCPLAGAALEPQGVYLLDDGERMLLWVGAAVAPQVAEPLFGCAWPLAPLFEGAGDPSEARLPALETDLSRRARAVIARLRAQRARWQQLRIVRQGLDAVGELAVASRLVEDAAARDPSYVDFLTSLHRSIQAKEAMRRQSAAAAEFMAWNN